MLRFRRFRNDDPPKLVTLWNESFTGRGAYPLRAAGPFERHVFSKPYFDPAGFIIAEDERRVVGFVHAGFGPNESETAPDPRQGVICALAVAASHRRRGLGTDLLRKGELYLATHGTRTIQAGPARPLNPFYFGLCGGSDQPGFLLSDTAAAPFFEQLGYQAVATTLVVQKRLDLPLAVADPRFAAARRRFELKVMPRSTLGTWWQECAVGLTEFVEFRLEDKLSGLPAARALAWEMEGFSGRWNAPAVGMLELLVRQDLRRQGLAKFLVSQVMRNLQEQFYGILEAQVPELNAPTVALFRTLGFMQADVGRVYRRDLRG